MQEFYLIINCLATITLLGLGGLALLRNFNLLINKLFAVFTLTSGIWIMASYVSGDAHNSPRVSVVGNYLVFLFSYISGYLLLWFVSTLATDQKAIRLLKRCAIPIIIVGVISGSPLVVAGVHVQGNVYAVDFGPLVALYALGMLIPLVASITVLLKGIKRTKGNQRAHILVLYRSLIFALPALLLTEFILPAATGWFGLINVGLLFWLIPVAALYYSVARYKLFDIRLIVVRSLAYLLSLGLILALYAFISTEVSRYLFADSYTGVWKSITNTSLVVVAALLYGPAKRYFDRITNKLFYRDAYDPQEFLNEINRVVVTNSNLEKMLGASSSVIDQHIKSEYTLFNLSETAYTPKRVIGATPDFMTDADIERLGELTTELHDRVVITDELDVHDELGKVLRKYNISLFAKLVTNLKYDLKGIGFLALGAKKSGNPYSKRDVNIIRIIAGELVIAIENALRYEEIENFNVTLQDKVDDATKRLKRANDKLKSLDETKDEFISMASHQLRTPLTSVKGYVSMVLEGDAGDLNPTQRKLLEQSFASSQRMVYLIADLLNLSRLRTGKFVIEAKPTNLADVIETEVDQLTASATSRNLTLTYEKPANFPSLMIDETKIRQVIMNFADNSIYYTKAGGKIDIRLRETKDSVEFTVNDNGIGIPAAEQHHLFNKFYRAKNAQKARPDGTGLGLFMAKKVIIAQGGAIVFRSVEGKGSTFGFTFSKQKLKVPAHLQTEPTKA